MGTCYYLIREDGPGYSLNKYWTFGKAILKHPYDSHDEWILLHNKPEDVALFAELLAMTEYEDTRWTREEHDQWAADLAGKIATWADGKPFVYVSEHDHRVEDAHDADDAAGRAFNAWCTGGN